MQSYPRLLTWHISNLLINLLFSVYLPEQKVSLPVSEAVPPLHSHRDPCLQLNVRERR